MDQAWLTVQCGTGGTTPAGVLTMRAACLLLVLASTGVFLRDLKSGKVSEPLPALSKYELDGAGINDRRDTLLRAVYLHRRNADQGIDL